MSIILIIVLFLFGMWFLANRWNRPQNGRLAVVDGDVCKAAGDDITITTWNIGFAALGAKADLFIDGGQNMRALPRRDIELAANTIADRLAELQSDIVLLQEDARVSFLTRGVKVHDVIAQKLRGYSRCFWADFRTLWVPEPLKFDHGVSIFSRLMPMSTTALTTPQDPLYYYGFLKKYYGGIVQKYPRSGQGDWVVINIHLSAFDEAARQSQLTALFMYAAAEHQAGNDVVIGGDWNMRLSTKEFAHDGQYKDTHTIFDLPMDALPKGWRVAKDDSSATLRSMNKPYVKGQNYTSVVDGFVVSPNVRIKAVKTHDLGFEHTDHHPVTAAFGIAH
ncbi:MAG: endonuclease/exonuclease/phosphatase family protein [Amylibacter sp.]|nr:endonuclease/exonuclease/phosphatase family protein [Amylibacter sp.]